MASCGSITRAAGLLSLSQPAVSQTIKLLERDLGTKLFLRGVRGMKLTAEGSLLFSYVSRGYEQLLLGERNLNRLLSLDTGEIHIGASDMTLQYFLLPFLEQFHRTHPAIKIAVTNAPTPETLYSLREGRIDFGVISSPFAGDADVEAFPVRELEDIFVAGSSFETYRGKVLPLKALEELPLIVLEGPTSTRSCLEHFLSENNVRIRPEFELATSGIIVQFALKNLGVGSVVADFADEALEDGRLFTLQFEKSLPKRHICVATSKSAPLPTAARALLSMIKGENK